MERIRATGAENLGKGHCGMAGAVQTGVVFRTTIIITQSRRLGNDRGSCVIGDRA
jgi:hypothetical protein